jgi:hypothetical protein
MLSNQVDHGRPLQLTFPLPQTCACDGQMESVLAAQSWNERRSAEKVVLALVFSICSCIDKTKVRVWLPRSAPLPLQPAFEVSRVGTGRIQTS